MNRVFQLSLPRARRAFAVLVAALLAPALAFASVGINKSFAPNSVVAGQVSVLTIVLLNPNTSIATGVNVTDTLPNDVIVASPLTIGTNTCGFATGRDRRGHATDCAHRRDDSRRSAAATRANAS